LDDRVLEIGAGDGRFALSLAVLLARAWPDVEITLLDRMAMLHEAVPERFTALGWRARSVTADVFDWVVSGERYDVSHAVKISYPRRSSVADRLRAG
jgi:hypothetical protein